MRKLLYVDDEAGLLEIVKFYIETEGRFSVEVANSVEKACTLLNDKDIDAVISDLHMPQCSGLDLVRHIKDSRPDIPIFIFSGCNASSEVRDVLNAGADRFYEKGRNILECLDDMMDKLDLCIDQKVAERVKEKERMDLGLLVESLSEMVICANKELDIIDANRIARSWLISNMQDVEGLNFADMVHDGDRKKTISAIWDSLRTGRPMPITFRLKNASEQEVYIELYATKATVGGSSSTIFLSMRDATHHHRTMVELEEKGHKLELMLDLTRHDLKNHLTVAEGYISLLKDSVAEAHKRRYLDKALSTMDAFRDQLNLLTLYQDLGMSEPIWQDIGAICNRVEKAIDLGNVRLKHDLVQMEIWADPMLEHVFRNIISNAIKHGRKVTHIDVSCQISEKGQTIIIEDDGIGIPQCEKEAIFAYGYRDRKGHGLHFIREVLSLTDIRIQEVGIPGLGSKFEIIVPDGGHRYRETDDNIRFHDPLQVRAI